MDFVTHFYENPAYPNSTYTVGHPALDDRTRIIAISDIHGNLPYFRGLVEKLHLRADDSLVLLGDLVEKGPESLATLRYAMALREKCRVYPVLGNCDFWHLWVDGCDMEWDVRTFAHLLRQKATARSGLILEMCAELGEVLSPDTDLAALKALRLRLSQEQHIPAYIICTNATLLDMAARRPRTIEELLEVSGIGQAKAERFGDAFLKELEHYEQTHGRNAP